MKEHLPEIVYFVIILVVAAMGSWGMLSGYNNMRVTHASAVYSGEVIGGPQTEGISQPFVYPVYVENQKTIFKVSVEKISRILEKGERVTISCPPEIGAHVPVCTFAQI